MNFRFHCEVCREEVLPAVGCITHRGSKIVGVPDESLPAEPESEVILTRMGTELKEAGGCLGLVRALRLRDKELVDVLVVDEPQGGDIDNRMVIAELIFKPGHAGDDYHLIGAHGPLGVLPLRGLVIAKGVSRVTASLDWSQDSSQADNQSRRLARSEAERAANMAGRRLGDLVCQETRQQPREPGAKEIVATTRAVYQVK